MLIGVVPDLALRRRTCYEPLVSTHPDTQGLAVPFLPEGLIAQFAGYDDLAELDWDHYRRTWALPPDRGHGV